MIRGAGKREPEVRCAICGINGGIFAAWGHPLCGQHWTAWVKEPSLDQSAINAALGQSEEPADYSLEANRRYAAEATKRTAAWVLEQRGGR